MATAPLPIEAVIPDLRAALRHNPNFVIRAEPGAGKTTVVPPVLLDELAAGTIVVTQPRRLAARLAAKRVAQRLGERVGERCGYEVRFDAKVGPNTRLVFMTEGLLARRLRDDPDLPGVAAVVLDEFHERRLDADLCLALARRLQRTMRPELHIGVMSATLDAEPVVAFLGATSLSCEGRTFPVAVDYAPDKGDRPLARRVSAGIRTIATSERSGSILVFLPGAREIREAREASQGLADHYGLESVSLHGELPAEQQDRAVEPGERPKLIFSTNVAETSVTIPGVGAVIDSGLARRAGHDPWTGIAILELAKIARASATQRAGRAGRTRAGRCLRLYSKADFEHRPAFELPEVSRLDLAGAALDLRAAGVTRPTEFAWFEAPPPSAIAAAEELLRRLNAVDEDGALTRIGRALLRFPVHPRLGRLLFESANLGVPRLGAFAAALLSERPIRLRRHEESDHVAAADVLVDIDALEDRNARNLDANACRQVRRVAAQLRKRLPKATEAVGDPDDALCRALMTGFSDRIAHVRPKKGAIELALAGGGRALLSRASAIRDAQFVVALSVERRKSGAQTNTIVRSAARIEPDWILEAFTDRIVESVDVGFDSESQSVIAHERLELDGLTIEESKLERLPASAARVLFDAAIAQGPTAFVDDPDRLEALYCRTAFASRHDSRIQAIDETRVHAALSELCVGRRSFAELRTGDLVTVVESTLPPAEQALLQLVAPTYVELKGGRRLVVHYERDRPPWIESWLQDFFGCAGGPRVAQGAVGVVIHLLAPNRRAVQVTTDLAGFWSRHYPQLRRALSRRYPKHAWPDDPANAEPPPRRRRRR